MKLQTPPRVRTNSGHPDTLPDTRRGGFDRNGAAWIVDGRGDATVVHATLRVDPATGSWTGSLVASVPWSALDRGRLVLEMPGEPWPDLVLRSVVELDAIEGRHASARGRAQYLRIPVRQASERSRSS